LPAETLEHARQDAPAFLTGNMPVLLHSFELPFPAE